MRELQSLNEACVWFAYIKEKRTEAQILAVPRLANREGGKRVGRVRNYQERTRLILDGATNQSAGVFFDIDRPSATQVKLRRLKWPGVGNDEAEAATAL